MNSQTVAELLQANEAAAPRRDGEPSRPSEDPRARAAWLAQLNQAYRVLEEAESEIGPGMFVAPGDEFAARLQSVLAELGEGERTAVRAGGLELRFQEGIKGRDLGWLTAARGHLAPVRPHPRPSPGAIEPLPSKARVVVLGDWGTGLYGAPIIANTIAHDPEPIHLLLHLGDVYYSGSVRETQERFLDLWPRRSDAVHRALNGNHEMYSGGHAYFDHILSAFRQQTSYFACQSEHWILIGLDTAYAQLTDGHLDVEQLAWLEGIMQQAGSRRVVLFSHHQLYSTLSGDGPQLLQALAPYLEARRIHSWYWGHEHLCVLYDQHPRFGLWGRCVGHGGVPYLRPSRDKYPVGHPGRNAHWLRLPINNSSIGALLLDGPNPYVVDKSEKYGPQGFMSLEFNGEGLTETVHLPDGEKVWESDLK